MVDFDQLTVFQDESLFEVNEVDSDLELNRDNRLIGWSWNMSKDLLEIERNGYTLLDWLSDIGGILGIAFSVFSSLIGQLNANYFNDTLISRLYKYQPGYDDFGDKGSFQR